MYRVLIVDDEVLVRVGLKTTIDWENIGFTVVAEASNGEQGYEQYKKYKPDVIITDIRMPKKDGLWLVEQARKENPDVKILVLTCYDEFSYARKALKVGADDYILKSEVEDEELISIMNKIKNKIEAQNRKKDKHIKVRKNTNDMKRALFDDMIKLDFVIDDKLKERCKNLEFPYINTKFVFLSIVVNNENVSKEDVDRIRQINQAVMNIFYEQLSERNIEYLFTIADKKYNFLLSSSKLSISELKRIFLSVENAAKQYFDTPVNVVYINPVKELSELEQIYKQYTKKSQILFYKTEHNASIIIINNITFNDVNVFDLKNEYNKQVIEYIGQENLDASNKLIIEVSKYFRENIINPKTAKIFYSNLVGDIFNSFGQLFVNNKDINNLEYYHYQIINCGNQEGIIELFNGLIGKVIEVLQNLTHDHSKLLVNRAINYIENNYQQKISLEDVAMDLNLSKHYLCNIFKKDIGKTMSLYINELRIEQAKKMLLKPDNKIKEIFEKVGFSNQQYFSKVFKKITGMTVMEYKEKQKYKINM
ncbi:hypothetical protein SH1V18_46830 [Vallitalea longa]|uniref:Stage 0 sporulation protein A homolog n=1 Tax=Vallitalea longa TaxID=2936439 RepID=A0A9W5YIZ4_9FIRM|nr:response regulator [Vallitalea longa]GKX32203.1 hypothetical protein SH1V18_46830 [Vallitalea longa]